MRMPVRVPSGGKRVYWQPHQRRKQVRTNVLSHGTKVNKNECLYMQLAGGTGENIQYVLVYLSK